MSMYRPGQDTSHVIERLTQDANSQLEPTDEDDFNAVDTLMSEYRPSQ